MAIFFFAVQSVRRAEGRSIVAAAAYRAAVRLLDERTGETFDYRRRAGVEAIGLVGWDADRSTLWNVAERAERRRDAVVGREVVLALPHEIPPDARRALVTGFAGWLHDRHGFAVDWAIHAPNAEGDQRNSHAHLLLTTRRVDVGAFGAKTRELDERRHSRQHIEAWREQWAERCNDALRHQGLTAVLDHRSYRRQARATGTTERDAQRHLGPRRTGMMRRGLPVRAALDNAWTAERNKLIGRLEGRLSQTTRTIVEILAGEPTGRSRNGDMLTRD